MTDLAASLLPRLTSRTLPGLTLWPEAVPPAYDGHSIANLPSSLAAWLGAPAFGMGPLAPELTEPLGDDVRRVVVILVDALGFVRFQSQLREPGSPWERLQRAGLLGVLTSVFPSTTVSALTSLWTGRAPGEHGMLGYEMWLKEYGVTANMIQFSPMATDSQPDRLKEAGFDPAKFLTVPTLGAHFNAASIPLHSFVPAQITDSGISRMLLAGSDVHPFFSPADLWVNLREFLEATAGQKQLCWAYWPLVDTLSHYYGPHTERAEHETAAFGRTMADAFLHRLSPRAAEGTLLLITADHGQVLTENVEGYDLRHHPEFTDMLHILPTGENRAAYLHCRPGQVEGARRYIETHWRGQFVVEETAAVRDSGLMGNELDGRTAGRLGELLAFSKGAGYLWWERKPNRMLGRHGSLTADEMLVPFLAARLDQVPEP